MVSPGTRGPVVWGIKGHQNEWHWKTNGEIEYVTRFTDKKIASVYKGTGETATLMAKISEREGQRAADITIPSRSSDLPDEQIFMENTGESGHDIWRVKVKALGGLELRWDFEAVGNNDMTLYDNSEPPVKYGHCNDYYFALDRELPEAAIDELVIYGTATQILLSYLMDHDLSIATRGPEGRDWWECYQ